MDKCDLRKSTRARQGQHFSDGFYESLSSICRQLFGRSNFAVSLAINSSRGTTGAMLELPNTVSEGRKLPLN